MQDKGDKVMGIALLADVFNTILNTCVRNIDPVLKGVLLVCFVVVAFWCLSKVLKPKAKPDQSQISVGWLILSIVFFALAMIYIIF